MEYYNITVDRKTFEKIKNENIPFERTSIYDEVIKEEISCCIDNNFEMFDTDSYIEYGLISEDDDTEKRMDNFINKVMDVMHEESEDYSFADLGNYINENIYASVKKSIHKILKDSPLYKDIMNKEIVTYHCHPEESGDALIDIEASLEGKISDDIFKENEISIYKTVYGDIIILKINNSGDKLVIFHDYINNKNKYSQDVIFIEYAREIYKYDPFDQDKLKEKLAKEIMLDTLSSF